jgi:hypothetical protein
MKRREFMLPLGDGISAARVLRAQIIGSHSLGDIPRRDNVVGVKARF